MEKLTQVGAQLNAFTFGFHQGLLDPITAMYRSAVAAISNSEQGAMLLQGGARREIRVTDDPYSFYGVTYGANPLLWVSANDLRTHQVFAGFFDGLGIRSDVKSLVDVERDVVMYCGFFVIGNRLPQAAWHMDYFDGANAYTLLTPLFELDPKHGHLWYKDSGGMICRYRYTPGEAIILGDRFLHSTEPYPQTEALRVLVSLTFGSDKLEYWNVLQKAVGTQSEFLMLPCGHPRGTCECLRDIQ